MNIDYQIPEPFLFNPIKHHLEYIREFINQYIEKTGTDMERIKKDLRHIGTSVMDIYNGSFPIRRIVIETEAFLMGKRHCGEREFFSMGRDES